MNRLTEIILEFKEGNYNSFNEFYNQTSKLVYYMISCYEKRKENVEDLIQDTYMKFLSNISKCDIKKNPVNYLATIAKNIAINHYNISKREEIIEYEQVDIIAKNNMNESYIDLGIIDYLEGVEKEIVSLHIIGNLKFKDISKIVNKPLGTVLWIYNKAISYLKKKVDRNYEEKRNN